MLNIPDYVPDIGVLYSEEGQATGWKGETLALVPLFANQIAHADLRQAA